MSLEAATRVREQEDDVERMEMGDNPRLESMVKKMVINIMVGVMENRD